MMHPKAVTVTVSTDEGRDIGTPRRMPTVVWTLSG